MFNELVRLRDFPELQQLLSYYAEAGVATPGAWQNRLMELDGVEPRALARLHGELLAHEWVEQHSGRASDAGTPHRCWYRATESGIRALKQVLGGLVAGDDVLAGIEVRKEARRTIYRKRPARARKGRGKGGASVSGQSSPAASGGSAPAAVP